MSDSIHAAPEPLIRDLDNATPAEIDGKLAPTLNRINELVAAILTLGDMIADARPEFVLDDAERAKAQTAIAEHNREVTRLSFQAAPLASEYTRRDGWTRWYLVEGGHLHSDNAAWRCSRNERTRHYWMTEHSGRSAEEMIELAGDRVCTVCFPDAPVEPRPATGRFMTPAEAHAAALREQARRDTAAKKAAQITNPDGTELYVPGACADSAEDRTDLVKTERAASNRALQAAGDLAFYGTGHGFAPAWIATVDLCVAALAVRRGVDAQTVCDEINAKVAKKARRDGFTVEATI